MSGRGQGVKLEIHVSCRGLRNRDHFSRSDPVCLLFFKSRGCRTWKELGKTERLKNTNDPIWATTFMIDFYFEEKQRLRFAVFDWDSKDSDDTADQDDLGTVEVPVAELVRSPGNKLQKPLSPFKKEPGDCGWIVVSVEEKAGLKDMILFELGATNLDKKDLFSESDPFFTISKVNSDDSETLVYRSEFIKDDPNPQWSLVEISKEKLCNGDNKRKLKVEVLDYDENGKHDLIGNFTTTLEEILFWQMSSKDGFQQLQWDVVHPSKSSKRSYKKSGIMSLKSFKMEEDTTFLDYIRGGLRMHFVVAVDFTTSNGDPSDPESLHYYDEERMENPYTMAIRSIGDVFQEYDFDNQFNAIGFGGLIDGKTSHCFSLNGNPDNSLCTGIEGVIQAYHHSLKNVPLSDPACFAPVLEYVKKMAEDVRSSNNDYVVLLLITDGIIADMEETKRLLVENCGLPLSIILVGVGSGDMSNMNILDDDNRTMSYQGQKAERDIVQFVHMSKYLPNGCLDPITFSSVMDAANGKYLLAKDVLAEIPYQVVQYMQSNAIKPGIPDLSIATRTLSFKA